MNVKMSPKNFRKTFLFGSLALKKLHNSIIILFDNKSRRLHLIPDLGLYPRGRLSEGRLCHDCTTAARDR